MNMDMDRDAQGLKLQCKFVRLWRKFLRAKGLGSLYTPYNDTQPADPSNGHSLNQATFLPTTTRFEEVHCTRTDQRKASDSCSKLLARTKRHIRRHLSCRNFSFVVNKLVKKTEYPPEDVPKGSVAVYVGDEQEEQTRFVIPILHFKHPLFLHLLEETENVNGFANKGVLTIPCQVSDFEYIQWLIERERNQPWDLDRPWVLNRGLKLFKTVLRLKPFYNLEQNA